MANEIVAPLLDIVSGTSEVLHISLPIDIEEVEKIIFSFASVMNGRILIQKTNPPIVNNKYIIYLSQEETLKFDEYKQVYLSAKMLFRGEEEFINVKESSRPVINIIKGINKEIL